jgi:hypothetical protein
MTLEVADVLRVAAVLPGPELLRASVEARLPGVTALCERPVARFAEGPRFFSEHRLCRPGLEDPDVTATPRGDLVHVRRGRGGRAPAASGLAIDGAPGATAGDARFRGSCGARSRVRSAPKGRRLRRAGSASPACGTSPARRPAHSSSARHPARRSSDRTGCGVLATRCLTSAVLPEVLAVRPVVPAGDSGSTPMCTAC